MKTTCSSKWIGFINHFTKVQARRSICVDFQTLWKKGSFTSIVLKKCLKPWLITSLTSVQPTNFWRCFEGEGSSSKKKVCLIIMEASHAVLRQMMLSLELWLLSCWLYLITDESGRLLESGEALELRCSIGHHRRWQQQRKQRWATQQQPVLVGLMRAKNTIFHILRPFISQPDREERFIIVAWKMLKSFLKKRMLNLYVPSLYIPPPLERTIQSISRPTL